ncbi:MAG: murein L,D-transpeptidase catalytic domain family protein [Deltaproteobacteria bacterium]|nr:murein L,D-transpeptidase catalytic domain family protein [Deltaproteobacteria bacterium]
MWAMLPIVASLMLAASPAPTAQSLAAAAPDLPRPLAELALKAYARARERGDVKRDVLAVIDYSRPSTEKRLWVFDLDSGALLFHELVAHGRGSGDNLATRFSNRPHSLSSSLGLYATGDTYLGKHGTSLKLLGLEPGVNDQAEPRAVVIHGAEYVSDAFAKVHGRLGRSWGCPAVAATIAPKLIDALRGGAAVFAYYPDATWLSHSAFLN